MNLLNKKNQQSMNGYIANNAPLGINTTNAVIGNGMKGSSNMSLGIGGGGIP